MHVCDCVNKPNVFLAVMDAVRPDHLSCYGYSQRTTPNIDEIADEGVLFENAFSAAPWTPPSHASMFTGMYPSQHGVLGENLYLDEEIPTLADIFRSKGYKTLGICRNVFVGSQTGLDRGFEKFDSQRKSVRRLSLDWIAFCLKTDIRFVMYKWASQARVFRQLRKWILGAEKANQPFFIFVNYLDAHTPYRPPHPFKEKFEKTHNRSTDLQKITDVFNHRHGYPYVAEEIEVSREEWEVLRSWYDGEIAYIDFFLGMLFDFLRERALFDNTFVVITSDHGENFGDHHLANHVFCLYDSLLHVPLIMKCPEGFSTRKRISNIVSHVDILPTLLSLLNLESRHHISGVNLLPFQDRAYHKCVCAEYGPPLADLQALKRLSPNVEPSICSKHNRILKCIRSQDFKYIIGSDREEELYNLAEDPNENRNVIREFPEKAHEFKVLLNTELEGRSTKKAKPAFDDKMKRRLQELGYF